MYHTQVSWHLSEPDLEMIKANNLTKIHDDYDYWLEAQVGQK